MAVRNKLRRLSMRRRNKGKGARLGRAPFETNRSWRLVTCGVGRRRLRGRWLRHRCLTRGCCRLGSRLIRRAGSQHDSRENGK